VRQRVQYIKVGIAQVWQFNSKKTRVEVKGYIAILWIRKPL
jgi:ribosomal protein S17E